MSDKTVLSVDLGAESGRVIAVKFDGRSFTQEELHRFPNTTTTVNSTLHWDFLRLWRDIQAGIEKGTALNPASIGVDTWGVDFGLLDKQGNLIGNLVHYRDGRTDNMMERAFALVPRAEIFAQTGIQFMQINTLYQLLSLVENDSPQLDIADTFLLAPDLLNYWLTGQKVSEASIASTTQMVNPRTGAWATDLLQKLNIPHHILPEIVPSGTRLGAYDRIPVIASAGHDTASAVTAVPAQTSNFAYLSSGTWSLFGLELPHPILSDAALSANVTNEGGVNGTIRLLKNLMGMWLLQQSRAAWAAEGEALSYAELVEMAQAAQPFRAFINVNDPMFVKHGDMPQRIQTFCQQTRQPVPQSKGEIVRTILESLAMGYRASRELVTAVSNHPVEVIHIVGGGTQNKLLNQMTANATGLPVVTGPIEATVIGNAIVQLIALGEIADLSQARDIVASLDELEHYEPQGTTGSTTAVWEEMYGRYQEIVA
ncbi:MAG: rhamnulokinase [Ardenticatenaceae bacterium]|nr:rhamnulokinase [Ardenticatenaceae bacterium]MCB9445613.1 rhamnulokinase [Ardenticatenaceae bacterium]